MFLVHKREAVYKYTASTYSSHSLHRLNNSQSIHCRNYTVASAATRTSERCNYISKKNLPVDLMVRMNAEHVLFFPCLCLVPHCLRAGCLTGTKTASVNGRNKKKNATHVSGKVKSQ